MNTKTGSKAKVNYFVDLVIALGFALVAVSGIALLLVGPGGFHGGRNLEALQTARSMSRWTWKALHDWGAIVMGAGVLIHIVLHWKWITCMTRTFLSRKHDRSEGSKRAVAPQCQTLES